MNILKKKKGEQSHVTRRDYTHEMVLFILGSSECGKTTVWRQLQLIGDDSFPEDKKYFQKVIYGNTISSINRLLEIAEKHDLEITDENKERTERMTLTPISMSDFKLPRFPLRLVYDIKCIWEDEAIQSAYQITLTNPEFHTPGRLQYYMDNIFRILSPDFRPTDTDILSAYDSTDSLQTSDIYYRKIKINAQCYPAAVCDTKKWETFDEGLTPDVIVYIINLNDYDQFSPQDKTQNKLQSAIEAMTSFFTTKAFKACQHMIVLLNCLDLFMEKAASIDLHCCFSDYTDGLDADKALAYVNNVLTQKVADKGKTIKIVPITVLEKESLIPSFDELVDLALPSLPLASAISNHTPPPPSFILNGHPNGEKNNGVVEKAAEKAGDSNNNNSINTSNNNNNISGSSSSGAGTKEAPKKKKGKRLASVESGFESVQNRRKTMEDKHVIMDNFRTSFPAAKACDDDQCLYYGVYDGHGGGETSKIVEAELHKNILSDAAFANGEYEQAIKNGFLATDTHILTQPAKSGSTAVIALVVGNQLYVANAGDSECVMCKQIGSGKKSKIEHTLMSYKHVPVDEGEKQRISAAGGLVVFGRLFGSLAVSRSFGDRDYKDGGQHFVSAEPWIKQVELTPEDQFVVMACDGLWDKLSYEDVVGTVWRLRKEGKNATDICKALVQEAITKESMDNITVVLVFFTWKK